MTKLFLKDGAIVAGNVYMTFIFDALQTAFNEALIPQVVITSGNDSTHGTGSYHGKNRAIDARSTMVANKAAMVQRLKELLPPYFDVVFEPTLYKDGKRIRTEHFHIEADETKEKALT